ncbi:MAG: GntR family transcriptional regulator [Terrisporobacter othiniensis]|uniref:GntR family transcriptional regulator n=1 Tax=Terrisporobacter hibernicus TaxID=2813371 RepID=A0AAX2ZCN6_9FIRM|nr:MULTISPECIES: GntR family transcriptional regulator [Terrisporobacter]MDU4859873.1 GntR family transcriptional regulator [Terrisporobacter othiniensis]MDU6996455.1 GntR family transcriptional regulator [Terrisporobacter othiniensis]UEL47138.1 GntR family transcriptional regulator [Terrisporobacter hibernicus]SFJ09394.1 DNA-binding transcriptional regulator YhcF, GntR family [Terrisporobacter glycolicus]
MKFIVNDREPVYIQIIRNIKQKVVTGELKMGERLPSRREMAVNINVNPNTVQKAYKEMEEMGLINTIKNNQSTITEDENFVRQIRQSLINEAAEIFVEQMKAINVGKDEIKNIINEKYD